MIRLERVVGRLPADFPLLQAEARAGDYKMLDTLAAEWTSGRTRFDRPGEALYAAYYGATFAAIGGLTVERLVPGGFRMRRFYALAAYRRAGIARRIAAALLDGIAGPRRIVTTNAAAGSEPFWESLGFLPDRRNGWTHILAAAASDLNAPAAGF